MATDQNHQNDDEQFPGYPHYAAGEDITKQGNNAGRSNIDTEKMNANGKRESEEQRGPGVPNAINSEDTEDEDNVTKEDLEMLSASDQNRDMDDPDNEESMLDTTDDDGDPLNEQTGSYGTAGADLDVPGSAADDADEAEGEEDEENNYYSLGGDRNEDQENNQ